MIDTSGNTEIGKSWPKILLQVVFLGVLATFCLFITVHWFLADERFSLVVGSVWSAFALWGLFVLLRQAVGLQANLVTLSPEGLIDRRISDDRIPWSAITSINAARGERTGWLVLLFTAQAAMALPPEIRRKTSRTGLNATPRSLSVHSNTLAVERSRLHDALKLYHERYGPKSGAVQAP